MIVPIKQCRTAFYNANMALAAAHVINGYTLKEHHTAWIETYGVAPLLTNDGFSTWESLHFKSEQDYTMFLLKWS